MAGKGGPGVKAAQAEASLPKKLEQVVDQWFADQFHNSVVSRDTAVHNLIHDAKPALKKALADALGQTEE